MRFYHMEMAVSQPQTSRESTRQWVTGLVVIAATIISFIGFATVSLTWTLIGSTAIFLGLVAILWAAGGGKQGH